MSDLNDLELIFQSRVPIIEELKQTRPLSTVMAEKIQHIRDWASDRTVPVE